MYHLQHVQRERIRCTQACGVPGAPDHDIHMYIFQKILKKMECIETTCVHHSTKLQIKIQNTYQEIKMTNLVSITLMGQISSLILISNYSQRYLSFFPRLCINF